MIPQSLEQKIIRLHFTENWKVGTIATQVGVHHTTVRRVLESRGIDPKVTAKPSISDPYIPFMLEMLEKWPSLPASRLYGMVVERGYPGKQPHFRRIVARIRPRKPAEAFQRLSTLPGEQAQVDWAHCGTVKIGHAMRTVSAFVMVLSWSRMAHVRFFYNQRMGAFLAGHQSAFEALGGVPRVLLYDNLKSVVLERKHDAIRFNPTILEFANHCRYEARPVAPYRGNEKGIVERRIRHLRTSFLSGREIGDLVSLNVEVADWCRDVVGCRAHPKDPTMTVSEAWIEEKPRLRGVPSDSFPSNDMVTVKVGKTPYIRFDLNDYSVPHNRVRRSLTVLATPTTVRVVDGTEVVASHVRVYGKGEQIEDPKHLQALTEWKREARSARGKNRLSHAVPSIPTLLEGAAKRGHNLGSAVSALLTLLDTWGPTELEKAVREVIEADLMHIGAVRQVLERRAESAGTPPPIAVSLPNDPKARDLHVKPHALESYDEIEVNNEQQ